LISEAEADGPAARDVELPEDDIALAALTAGSSVGEIATAAPPTKVACRKLRRLVSSVFVGSVKEGLVNFVSFGIGMFSSVFRANDADRLRVETC